MVSKGEDMRIVITGAAGYIGGYLVKALHKDNDLLIIDKSWGDSQWSLNLLADKTIQEIEFYNPDLIYHLAAQTSVNKSFEDIEQDVKDNILTTVRLLSLKKKIIFVSSGAVYGNKLRVTERDKLKPESPYAISKVACENYIMVYGVPYVILRLGNVYGRNCNKGVIKYLKDGYPIFGTGNHIRDYIHIDDVVNALIMAPKWKQGIYNVGTGRGTTVNEIADLLGVEKRYAPSVPEQVKISLMAYKAKSQGWEPKIRLEEGINI